MILDFIDSDKINTEDKRAIAEVIKDGFWGKMRKYFNRVDKNEAIEILAKVITFNKGFYYKEDGKVLGVALLSTSDIPYINFLKHSKKRLGFFNAFLLHLGFALTKPKKQDGLKLEMIAVSPEARGKGVGTKMFDNLFKLAQNEGFKKATLEVIDTNIRAKELYEKLGFKSLKYVNSALFTSNMGFKGYYKMQKTLK